MVELALVLVLLVMLLVGTVSAAMAFGRGNSIQNAAREASRFGATYPPPPPPPPGNPDAGDWTDWLGDVRDVARAAASGDLDASVPGSFICVAHLDGANIESLEDNGGAISEPDTECFSDGRPTNEARVQVVVERDTDFQVIVFSTDITLSAEASARFER